MKISNSALLVTVWAVAITSLMLAAASIANGQEPAPWDTQTLAVDVWDNGDWQTIGGAVFWPSEPGVVQRVGFRHGAASYLPLMYSATWDGTTLDITGGGCITDEWIGSGNCRPDQPWWEDDMQIISTDGGLTEWWAGGSLHQQWFPTRHRYIVPEPSAIGFSFLGLLILGLVVMKVRK